jgi:hypothetical protein
MMDFSKLRLEQFTTYNGYHIPADFQPPLTFSEQAQVYFLFVSSIKEVMEAINFVQNQTLPKDNRLFFVYQKGNKMFHRDHIYRVVMKHKNIVRKAPILSRLNEEYSIFSFMLKKDKS